MSISCLYSKIADKLPTTGSLSAFLVYKGSKVVFQAAIGVVILPGDIWILVENGHLSGAAVSYEQQSKITLCKIWIN